MVTPVLKTFTVEFWLAGHDEGYPQRGKAIEWRGGLWLVLEWIESNATGERTPVRLLRIDSLGATPGSRVLGFDFLVPNAIPIALFEGRTPPETPVHYEVADYPVIAHIPVPGSTH